MGLDTSHGAWHGAYSSFMTWREKIAEVAGLPPLRLMEGFYRPIMATGLPPSLYAGAVSEYSPTLKDLDKLLPIKWSCLNPSPLHGLLYHSDCDGEIEWDKCEAIADELETLLPLLPNEEHWGHIGDWKEKTQTFINGLRLAFSKKENLNFH